MMTATETRETNAVFSLQSENGTGSAITTRRLSLPGAPSNDDQQGELLAAFASFRQMVLNEQPTFIQPSSWRDSTGSDTEESDSAEPYRTINVGLETVITNKTTWDGSDFDPGTLTIEPSNVTSSYFSSAEGAGTADFVCTTSIENPTWSASGKLPIGDSSILTKQFVEVSGKNATLRITFREGVVSPGQIVNTFTITAANGVQTASNVVTVTGGSNSFDFTV